MMNVLGSILVVFCIGSLLMLNWRLLMKVVRQRRRKQIAIGVKDAEMERVVAAHRNFIENTPINLVAPAIVYVQGYPWLALIPLILLLAGRLFHARSIQRVDEAATDFRDRTRGMKLTFAATISGIAVLAVSVVLQGI